MMTLDYMMTKAKQYWPIYIDIDQNYVNKTDYFRSETANDLLHVYYDSLPSGVISKHIS